MTAILMSGVVGLSTVSAFADGEHRIEMYEFEDTYLSDGE